MAHFDIAVIGTGSGNSILDERYAGKRVAICEQGVFGGTCLNVGCIPTKMFVYAAEVAQSVRESAQYGVDAHVDGVRWNDIVSRVFGRIDPIALGGENYRRAAVISDRILKGQHPADIAVERPNLFELVLNERAAAGLGISIPKALQQQASRVIT